MYAKVRDTELFFDMVGEAAPDRSVAFLIHGGPGTNHLSLKRPFAPLAEQMRLVYFDHRGQGQSARGDVSKYNLDENVEDMEALRRHIGAGPIVSIGTSYGGMVAMAHAARYPEAVSHLVLVATAAHAGFNARGQQILKERGTLQQREAAEILWAGAFRTPEQLSEYFAVMAPLYSRTHKAEVSGPAASADVSLLSPDAINQAFRPGGFLRSFDLRPELSLIKASTLILGGGHDWICAPEFSTEIHALISGSTLRVFENSGHSIRMDCPVEMIALIRDHIGKSVAIAPLPARQPQARQPV